MNSPQDLIPANYDRRVPSRIFDYRGDAPVSKRQGYLERSFRPLIEQILSKETVAEAVKQKGNQLNWSAFLREVAETAALEEEDGPESMGRIQIFPVVPLTEDRYQLALDITDDMEDAFGEYVGVSLRALQTQGPVRIDSRVGPAYSDYELAPPTEEYQERNDPATQKVLLADVIKRRNKIIAAIPLAEFEQEFPRTAKIAGGNGSAAIDRLQQYLEAPPVKLPDTVTPGDFTPKPIMIDDQVVQYFPVDSLLRNNLTSQLYTLLMTLKGLRDPIEVPKLPPRMAQPLVVPKAKLSDQELANALAQAGVKLVDTPNLAYAWKRDTFQYPKKFESGRLNQDREIELYSIQTPDLEKLDEDDLKNKMFDFFAVPDLGTAPTRKLDYKTTPIRGGPDLGLLQVASIQEQLSNSPVYSHLVLYVNTHSYSNSNIKLQIERMRKVQEVHDFAQSVERFQEHNGRTIRLSDEQFLDLLKEAEGPRTTANGRALMVGHDVRTGGKNVTPWLTQDLALVGVAAEKSYGYNPLRLVAQSDAGLVFSYGTGNSAKRKDFAAAELTLAQNILSLYADAKQESLLKTPTLKILATTKNKSKTEIMEEGKARNYQVLNSSAALPVAVAMNAFYKTELFITEHQRLRRIAEFMTDADLEKEFHGDARTLRQLAEQAIIPGNSLYNVKMFDGGFQDLIVAARDRLASGVKVACFAFSDNVYAFWYGKETPRVLCYASLDASKMEGSHTKESCNLLLRRMMTQGFGCKEEVSSKGKFKNIVNGEQIAPAWYNYLTKNTVDLAVDTPFVWQGVQGYTPGLTTGFPGTGYFNNAKMQALCRQLEKELTKPPVVEAEQCTDPLYEGHNLTSVATKGVLSSHVVAIAAAHGIKLTHELSIGVVDGTHGLGQMLRQNKTFPTDFLGFSMTPYEATKQDGTKTWRFIPVLDYKRLIKALAYVKAAKTDGVHGAQANMVKLAKIKMLFLVGGWAYKGTHDLLLSYSLTLKEAIRASAKRLANAWSSISGNGADANALFDIVLEEMDSLLPDDYSEVFATSDLLVSMVSAPSLPTMGDVIKLYLGDEFASTMEAEAFHTFEVTQDPRILLGLVRWDQLVKLEQDDPEIYKKIVESPEGSHFTSYVQVKQLRDERAKAKAALREEEQVDPSEAVPLGSVPEAEQKPRRVKEVWAGEEDSTPAKLKATPQPVAPSANLSPNPMAANKQVLAQVKKETKVDKPFISQQEADRRLNALMVYMKSPGFQFAHSGELEPQALIASLMTLVRTTTQYRKPDPSNPDGAPQMSAKDLIKFISVSLQDVPISIGRAVKAPSIGSFMFSSNGNLTVVDKTGKG